MGERVSFLSRICTENERPCSKAPSMSNLPLDVIHKIVEKVEPIERLSVRKVCRNFRAIVDNKDPGIKRVVLNIHHSQFQIHSHCTVNYNDRNERFKGVNGLKMAETDLSVVMKNSKLQLEVLEFQGYDRIQKKETFMNWFKEMSDSKNLYKVKRIDFSINLPTFAATIFPLLQPGFLEEICIYCSGNPDYVDQLFEMEQWKRAKSIFIDSYGEKHFPIENLFHLTHFFIDTAYLSVADAVKIRDILLKSTVFESGIITSRNIFSVGVVRVFNPNFIARRPFRVDYDNGSHFSLLYDHISIKIEKKK
ncbi:F-box domain-containing protein [Caenorhabditis elegans]|uniref:F-box domain-containing protein n=1 Tax=Caenorhabditis elegans TaxID=6239 RepID=A0A4V0IJX0_CAEEL|nr:F-box domain-containing protein [Caenorhabditis elegans]VTW47435.1 F-box domain-containing protein [Caenorhabditis elegans]